jgi:hypothetical protein
MRRRHGHAHCRLTAWLLALCLLFSQTAAIAYACQRQSSTESAPGEHCTAHLQAAQAIADAGAPPAANLCEVHCQSASLPDASTFDHAIPADVVAWWIPASALAGSPTITAIPWDAKNLSPPPRTLYSRLLI